MSNLPLGFVERLNRIWSPEVVSSFVGTFKERPPTIRINTIKGSRDEIIAELINLGVSLSPVSWYQDAFIVTNRTKREVTELKSYQEGRIYIQSLASMVPPLVLDPKPGERVLDLTAAPGSKTSQIASLMANQGLLVANDNSRDRFFRLKRNLEQLGVANSSLDLQLRLEHGSKIGREYNSYFDKVLLDAPCSSEARFIAGNDKSFGYWKEKKLSEIAKRQRPLIMAATNALRPGGTLVYSTCTISPEENEMQIDWLLRKVQGGGKSDDFTDEISNGTKLEVMEIRPPLNTIKRLPPVTNWRDKALSQEVLKTLHILPTEEMEGFFVATIKKY